MEDVSYILAPVQEQFVEYFIDKELIEVVLELFGEDVVEFVDNRQDLLKEVRMFRVEDRFDSRIEVIVMEVVRE